MKLKTCFILLLILGLGFFSSPINAQHFSSSSYIIDWGNFNITSGKKTSTTYQLTDTVGQNAPGKYTGSTLKIKSGFQYIYDTLNQLSFSIDKLEINLGTLVPQTAATDTNTLTITTPSGRGYQLLAQENHPLWINNTSYIPDTSCNLDNCTPSSSAAWDDNNVPGFGFHVASIGATIYFPNTNSYRPFANTSISEIPQAIMSENIPVKDRSAVVTYKAVISNTQASGDYENLIIYTLVPKY